ncbi:MAG TPA: hypothetical protein DC034_08740 [Clostridium sp.]|jgi:archaellum component FlaG (FlaF/FlaG flagellin family)|nr:hypothetical protein [Clostridium sp.]
MFKQEYKNDFNSITPDINLVDKTIQRFNTPPKKHSRIGFIAATMTICLLIVGGFMVSNLTKPTFSLVAFADDSDSQHVDIAENAQIILPFGKISRGNRHFYLDETGKKVYTYDVGFDSGGISVKGKNISSVKYTSVAGELQYFVSSQQGKEITTTFHEELGNKSFDVYWNPWHAIDIISEYGSTDFVNLPEDNITITVFFTNGRSITKHLQLSFNKEGNLIAKVTTEQ